MTTTTLSEIDIVRPEHFAAHGYQWEAWDLLRKEDPIHLYERDFIEPFWAVTKHSDIQAISRNPEVFGSTEGVALTTKEQQSVQERRQQESAASGMPEISMFINMDPPQHALYRNVVSKRFTPRALAQFMPRIEELSTEVLDDVVSRVIDEMAEKGSCDFVIDVAAKLPIYAICEMLGVPREDGHLMFRWTNEQIGGQDPEYQDDADAQNTAQRASMQMNQYFYNLMQERRANPKDDVISMLLQGNVEGRPLTDGEVIGHCILLIIAGNETTRNATTGGMLALIQHPDEQEKLRKNPDLAFTAVEEILRWTSPLIHFARVARHDTEYKGRQIKKGQKVALFYPSANRDEDVFKDPYTFNIERDPNDHLAFGGYGEHFCLGANLARAELRAVYKEILSRITDIELAGDVQRLHSGFVGGIKHMPITFRPLQ